MTSTLAISQPRSVDLLPPTLQTIPEAIGKNIAIARARSRFRIIAVFKADGYGHGAVTVARAGLAMAFKLVEAARARWRGVNAPHLVALVRAGARFANGNLLGTTRRIRRRGSSSVTRNPQVLTISLQH
jgi:alanine racemase